MCMTLARCEGKPKSAAAGGKLMCMRSPKRVMCMTLARCEAGKPKREAGPGCVHTTGEVRRETHFH